jgi:hypothetical protein
VSNNPLIFDMTNCETGKAGGLAARLLLLMAPLLLLLAAGCQRDTTKVYRVANGQDQTPQQTAPALPTDSPNQALPPGHPDISTMPATPAGMDAAGAPPPTWTTPSGWTEAAPGEMRVASFKITGAGGKTADVSVIPLAGMAGGDDANVNRWRGQVGLASVSSEELQKAAEKIEAGGQPAQLYDVAGTDQRILGVIQHRGDMTWFYKMTGDTGLVEQQKPAFIEFLKSLNFGAAAAAAQTALPSGHPAIGDMGTMPPAPAISSGAAKPNWQVPAGWQEVPAAQFLLAEFSIAGANGAKAEVNVAQLDGDGGGLLANINRWRRQIGLAALDEAGLTGAVTSLDVAGGKGTLVDMSGTDAQTGQPTRLVGVIVPMNGGTWFYKLMGDSNVVESQKAAFTQFVRGVKY